MAQQEALLVDLRRKRPDSGVSRLAEPPLGRQRSGDQSGYKPVPASTPAASNCSGLGNQNKKGADKTKSSNDPLQALRYEKSSLPLQAEGPYQGLLQFLISME